MLFREAMAVSGKTIKLQVLASDIDGDAVRRRAKACTGDHRRRSLARTAGALLRQGGTRIPYRSGPARHCRFHRAGPSDRPPFSRLDFVSCRNLLIYLGQEAQAKVMDIFHFALREGGILLLGAPRRSAKPMAVSPRFPRQNASSDTQRAAVPRFRFSRWRRRAPSRAWSMVHPRGGKVSPICASACCWKVLRRRGVDQSQQ